MNSGERAEIEEVEECFGKIDTLVNNGWISSSTTVAAMDLNEWTLVMNINLAGSVFEMNRCILEMK